MELKLKLISGDYSYNNSPCIFGLAYLWRSVVFCAIVLCYIFINISMQSRDPLLCDPILLLVTHLKALLIIIFQLYSRKRASVNTLL